MDEREIAAMLEQHARTVERRAEVLPDAHACLRVMMDAYCRLKELGWNDAIYCPKDGSVFKVIEFGSTGIFDCHYDGEWPKGRWWTHAVAAGRSVTRSAGRWWSRCTPGRLVPGTGTHSADGTPGSFSSGALTATR